MGRYDGWKELSESDAKRLGAGRAVPAKPSKYRNVKTVVSGERFDSKAEASYWLGLKAREAAGHIHTLRRQVSYPLYAPTKQAGICAQVSEFIADFDYFEKRDGASDRHVVADKKGKRTAVYLLKRKWLDLQEGIQIEEV